MEDQLDKLNVTSGAHLGTIRTWIQRKAKNGEHVKWGSLEILELMPLSVMDMEQLAEDIKRAVVREYQENLKREQKTLKQLWPAKYMDQVLKGVDLKDIENYVNGKKDT